MCFFLDVVFNQWWTNFSLQWRKQSKENFFTSNQKMKISDLDCTYYTRQCALWRHGPPKFCHNVCSWCQHGCRQCWSLWQRLQGRPNRLSEKWGQLNVSFSTAILWLNRRDTYLKIIRLTDCGNWGFWIGCVRINARNESHVIVGLVVKSVIKSLDLRKYIAYLTPNPACNWTTNALPTQVTSSSIINPSIIWILSLFAYFG